MAVNHKATQALTVFADDSRHADAWAANLYADARARGKRHPHAIRILARAWIRVMWQCWKTNNQYDPASRGHETPAHKVTNHPHPTAATPRGRRRGAVLGLASGALYLRLLGL